jgi:hypothetical protein
MERKITETRAILPCQSDQTGVHALSPEQRLMLALLVDALNVYQKGARSRRPYLQGLHIDAERWFLQKGRAGIGGFSFSMVCDALGIDAAQLRRRIIDWKHTISP